MRERESGRTLIETLAVVAIIGVLSVFGLHLYAKAMNAIRSNYLMQQVFIKANELMENKVANEHKHKMVDVSIYSGNTLSYGYSFCSMSEPCAPRREEKQFVIKVNGFFPVGLCDILKKKIRTQEYAGLKNIQANTTNLLDNDCATDFEITSMTFFIDSEFKKQSF